jgi:hypothetical protein
MHGAAGPTQFRGDRACLGSMDPGEWMRAPGFAKDCYDHCLSSPCVLEILGCAPHEVHGRPLRFGDRLRIPVIQFISLSDQLTMLISEETFKFHGLFHKVCGFFARAAIKRAHRRHMESFKRSAESQR